jgi:hypothetical protein
MKNLFLASTVLFFISCGDCENHYLHYKNDLLLSDKVGKPRTDSTFIFPYSKIDKASHSNYSSGLSDTGHLGFVTQSISFANEPLLYNFYLGNDVFRFILTQGQRKDTSLFIFRVEKKFDKTIIHEKRVYLNDLIVTQNKSKEFIFRYSSSTMNEYTKECPSSLWDSLVSYITQKKFLCIPSELEENKSKELGPYGFEIIDGWDCFMEYHCQKGYYMVSRYIGYEYEDDKDFEKIYFYLKGLTTLKNN